MLPIFRSRLNIGLSLFKSHETKVRFLLVGALNTAVGLSVFPLLFFLITPEEFQYLYILIISHLICISFSFVTIKLLVFQTSGNYMSEIRKFILFHILNFLMNLVMLPLLVEVAGMHPVWAQTLFTSAIIMTSYFWHSRITFIASKI